MSLSHTASPCVALGGDCQIDMADDSAVCECGNGVQDGSESDIDCGGTQCVLGCNDGLVCSEPSDCLSSLCSPTTMLCTCPDGILNNSETDVDCGGAQCPARCILGQTCMVDTDCEVGLTCLIDISGTASACSLP